jgi:hypothetical protein
MASVRTLVEVERAHILEALQRVGLVVGGQNGAAARLGLARTMLLHRMKKLGLFRHANATSGNDAAAVGLGKPKEQPHAEWKIAESISSYEKIA